MNAVVEDDVCEEATIEAEASQTVSESIEPELIMDAEAIVVDVGEILKLSCTVKGASGMILKAWTQLHLMLI